MKLRITSFSNIKVIRSRLKKEEYGRIRRLQQIIVNCEKQNIKYRKVRGCVARKPRHPVRPVPPIHPQHDFHERD